MVDSTPTCPPDGRTLTARAAVRALRHPGSDGHVAAADLPQLLAMRAELDAAITARLTVVDRTQTWQQTGARAQWSWLAALSVTPTHPVTDENDGPDDDGPDGRGSGPAGGGVRPAPMGQGSAQRWVALARDLREFPVLRDAHAQGRVSTEHAHVIGKALRELGKAVIGTVWNTPAWLDAQERAVLQAARFADPARLRKELTARLHALAPLPAAADAEGKRAKRHVRLTPGYDGMWNLTGLLDPDSGQVLNEALQAWRRNDHRAGDNRTPAQRDSDALTALAQQFLAAGLTTQRGVTPHVIVHVPLARVEAHEAAQAAARAARAGQAGGALGLGGLARPGGSGRVVPDPFRDALVGHDGQPVPPATYGDGTPVAETTLSQYLCTGRLTRLVLDADSRPLDVGRTSRVFTWPMWVAAMKTWGNRCATDGCTAPATRLELHHALWWRDGGTTSLDNCIPLCHGTASCHTRVHDGHTLRLRDGQVLDRHGLHPPLDLTTTATARPAPPGRGELRRTRPDQITLERTEPHAPRQPTTGQVWLAPPPGVLVLVRDDHRHRPSRLERDLADLLHQHGTAA